MFSKIISLPNWLSLRPFIPSRSFTTIREHSFKEIPVLTSIFNSQSELYQSHKQKSEPLLSEFSSIIEKVSQGGSKKILQSLRKQNRFPARERIDSLLDSGSPFLELSQLAGYELYQYEETPSGGLITGIGLVHGRFCMIIANDFSVKKGQYYPITIKKHIRAQEIARENKIPCIYLLDPGCIDFSRHDETFPDRDHFGQILYQQGKMASEGVPQVSIVLGNCAGSVSYIPAMSDETIVVKKHGSIFLGALPILKSVTAENLTADALGGADVTSRVSGLSDHFASDEAEALLLCRDIVANLNLGPAKFALRQYEEPVYSQEDLNYVVDPELQEFVEAREIISRIVDGSRFLEFKKTYGYSLVTGFGTLYGHEVGVIANNGILQGEASLKGAHFVELCSQRNVPLIFLHNTSGFVISKKNEEAGILKHNAKMLQAIISSEVPKLSLIVGKSYGTGHYNMCGRSNSPNFLYSWPTAKLGLVDHHQAAFLLHHHERLRTGEDWTEEDEERILFKFQGLTKKQSSYSHTSARLWDDGVILPQDTRKVLGLSLMVALNHEKKTSTKQTLFRM